MMQNRRAKRDDYKPSAVRVTQRYVPGLTVLSHDSTVRIDF
ncbi:hypothetical protein [Piscirickettsia salmonis]|nr:hypothetical protein [Piscirickettsia salmonis]